MMKNYLLLILISFCTLPLSAQVAVEEDEVDEEYLEEPEYNFKKTMMLGINFQLGLPQGAMKRNLDKTAFGFGGNILGNIGKESPIFAGLDFSIQTFDRESLIEAELVNGILEEFRVTTKNQVMNAHFLVRYEPPVNFYVQPFVEGMLGTKWFYTRTEVTDANGSANETLSSDFDRGDWAASVGAAVGFQINLSRNYLYLEGRCAYLKGTSAEYLARIPDNTSVFIDPIEAFEPRNSVTDLLIPQIGLKFLMGIGNQDEEVNDDFYEEEELEEEY